MEQIEFLILKNLLHNEKYLRKSLPFIKAEYFQDSNQKIVFEEISSFVEEYNDLPTKEILTIEVEKTQKLYDFLLTVAHEMVHVKQTVRKQLTEKNLTHFWYGQRHTDRRNEPWEIEAWKLQKPLTHGFIKKRLERRIKDVISIDTRL